MEETLGKRISARRKGLGLTQDALAERLGVTAQAVSKWENDQSCPDITMLPKLAEVFACTTDALLGIERNEITVPADTEPALPEAGAAENSSRFRERLTSPPAAFACWLFLTGLVALIDTLHPYPCDLWDIAIACGIFTFGLFGFFRRFSLLRLGCAVAGGIFVCNLLLEPGISSMDWTVPLTAGLCLLGLDLLIHTLRKPKEETAILAKGHKTDGTAKNYCNYDGEAFECNTSFGGSKRLIQLPRLSGGEGEVAFGELHIDLSGCGEIADGCSIELNCSFGSLEILVPRHIRVETISNSAFGSVEEKGNSDPDAQTTLSLECNVSFGEILIRHI